MQSSSDISEQLAAALPLPRSMRETHRLQKAPHLSRQNRRLGREIIVEEFGIRIVNVGRYADHLSRYDQRRGHNRLGLVLRGHRVLVRIELVEKQGSALPD